MERIKNAYQTLLEDFLKFDILVKCTNCGCKAKVLPGKFFSTYQLTKEIKVVCTNCGFNKNANHSIVVDAYKSNNTTIQGILYTIGGPYDPFFQMPVWLQIKVGSHLLWAYNYEHLAFLKTFVSAKIRERNHSQTFSNKSVGSRLPRWLTAAKNRDEVLKKINQLMTLNI